MSDLIRELRDSAWIGDSLIKGEVRGLSIEFHGMDNVGLKTKPKAIELHLAEQNILSMYPYVGPWSYMAPRALRYTERLLDLLFTAFELPADLPIVPWGGSMGGAAALIYALRGRRQLSGCAALYPASDLKTLYQRKIDLPIQGALRSSFSEYPGGFEAALEDHSPNLHADVMPRIPYHIAAGDRDEIVPATTHAIPLSDALKAHGHEVELRIIQDFGHEFPVPEIEEASRLEFICKCVDRARAKQAKLQAARA